LTHLFLSISSTQFLLKTTNLKRAAILEEELPWLSSFVVSTCLITPMMSYIRWIEMHRYSYSTIKFFFFLYQREFWRLLQKGSLNSVIYRFTIQNTNNNKCLNRLLQNIDDILHKDAGCGKNDVGLCGTSWDLFLEVLRRFREKDKATAAEHR
jgi:hypothetical protein